MDVNRSPSSSAGNSRTPSLPHRRKSSTV